MKVKQHPEDFRVEELTAVSPSSNGTFAFYRLTKQSLGTPEALERLSHGLRIAPQRISYGGLKDTHALTTQHVTIAHGPRQHWRSPPVELEYLGQASAPFQSKDILANRFTIVLRDLSMEGCQFALEELPHVAASGVANYFDDQRFGSVTADGQFVARYLIEDDYEGALRLALGAPYAHDSSAMKKSKQFLRNGWGDWARLRAELPRGPAQRVAAFLATRPKDFRGALLQLPHSLLTLYLSAYQSHLWNAMLACWLASQFPQDRLLEVRQKSVIVVMPARLTEEERERLLVTELPYPSARLKVEETSPWRPIVDEVMTTEGVPLAALKLKHIREVFFSKGARTAWFVPQEMTWQTLASERGARQDLKLRFTLPRGCYATMLIKRISRNEGHAEE